MIGVLIVPVLNGHNLLDRMLSSIDYPIENVIVVDNGKDANWEYSFKNPHIENLHHLQMPTNLGVPVSWNLGIKSLPFADYWLIVNHDIEFCPGSLNAFEVNSNNETLLLSNGIPRWCAFSIGSKIIETVGLFDEAIYPAYFEDTEYEWRCNEKGIKTTQSDIGIKHENSSTLKGGYEDKNAKTFRLNNLYFNDKQKANDLTQGDWSLIIRKNNSWD
jgi:GT2 family glycosyltransferase